MTSKKITYILAALAVLNGIKLAFIDHDYLRALDQVTISILFYVIGRQIELLNQADDILDYVLNMLNELRESLKK